MEKKVWLDKLYYDFGKQHTDFKIFGLHKDLKTKWIKYSEVCFELDPFQTTFFLEKVNNRTICENEIVLDIEDKNNIEKIKGQLKNPILNDCNILMYDTGSRGIHIHLWFKNPINENLKKSMIKIFDADEMKTTGKPIALENFPHWKTNKKKELIWVLKNL